MKYLLTNEEVRNCDLFAINNLGIPSIVLMENAARSASEKILELSKNIDLKTINIFCGSGNNGGDGYAIARHLSNHLTEVIITVFSKGSIDKMSEETETNYFAIEQMKIKNINLDEIDINNYDFKCDLIIDALIGVGGNENLRGNVVPLLKKINEIEALKVAIDVPTGINSDNGFSHEEAFIADYTVTMFSGKIGMYLNEAKYKCGKISVADLGAPTSIVKNTAKSFILEENDFRELLPYRKDFTSKFDFGKVLIIGGNGQMPGAAALTANSASRSGAGLTYLVTKKMHFLINPEVLVQELEGEFFEESDFEKIDYDLNKFNTIAIGPGIGNNEGAKKFVKKLILEIPDNVSLILDADALKAIDVNDKLRPNIILTPHLGEFANMLNLNYRDISDNCVELAKDLAKKLNCVIHLKHHPSITTNGEYSFYLTETCAGLSAGGSGDVLTGIIASMVSQGIEPLEATGLGAYLHLKSAQRMSENIGNEAFCASDIIEGFKRIFL